MTARDDGPGPVEAATLAELRGLEILPATDAAGAVVVALAQRMDQAASATAVAAAARVHLDAMAALRVEAAARLAVASPLDEVRAAREARRASG